VRHEELRRRCGRSGVVAKTKVNKKTQKVAKRMRKAVDRLRKDVEKLVGR
jgi:BMFP domain-containing protein YqiC